MDRRRILMFALGILVLSGLVTGMFAGSMENALGMAQGTQTLTNTQGTQQTQGHPNPNTPVATPPGKTPTNNNNQQTQQGNVLATDTFQRQNQALWGTASDGHQWGGDANTNQAFSINGSKGQITGGQGALEALIGPPTADVDITINGSVNQFSNQPNQVNLGIVLRWQDTNNWYKAFIDGNNLIIAKKINGTTSVLNQMAVQIGAGVSETLRFRSLGAMLFAKVWPTGTTEPQQWLIADDQTFTTGQFGIRVLEQPTTTITITSFNATTTTIESN